MNQLPTFSKLFAQLLKSAALTPSPRLAADLIDVRVPHAELDLNNFWAFSGTAD
jgi:hypothetical protein